MTSLKAISTLRKKSKFLLALLTVFLLSASVLGAESLRVTVGGDEESYITLFSSVLSSFSTVSSDTSLTLRREREEREEEKTRLKRITEESKKEEKVEEKTDEKEEYTSLTLEVVSSDFSAYSAFLSSSDEDAYLYLRVLNSLDAIFWITGESDGDISRITVLLNGNVIHTAWYNTAMRESEEGVIYSLLSSLLLGDGYHLYKLNLTPSDATLVIDGTLHDGDSDYVILPDGEHTFSLSGYGYEDESFSLSLDGEKDEIALSLSEARSFPLLVTTYPYSAELSFNGFRKDGRYFPSVVTPYVITLENEGFGDYSYQERRSYSHITLEMAPLWTESGTLLEEKKSAFYSSLFYVLLSFGGYVASESITNYYSVPLGTAGRTVFTGASILSLVNLIQNAVDYYNTAGYGL